MANPNFNRHELSPVDETKTALRYVTCWLMHQAATDETWCNTYVAGGRQAWRIDLARRLRVMGLPCNDELADKLFAFLCRQVRKRYRVERSDVSAKHIAKVALDHTEEVHPPTPDEIIDGLELDSACGNHEHDDARRHFYGRDGSPEQTFAQLKDEAKAELREGLWSKTRRRIMSAFGGEA